MLAASSMARSSGVLLGRQWIRDGREGKENRGGESGRGSRGRLRGAVWGAGEAWKLEGVEMASSPRCLLDSELLLGAGRKTTERGMGWAGWLGLELKLGYFQV